MEDGIYLCRWKETSEGFELWMKSRPQIRAKGRTYLEAEDAFLATIAEVLGVYHAVLEFVPPLPHSEFDRRYATPELYVVLGDDRFEADEPRRIPFETDDERAQRQAWYDNFFTLACCRTCGFSPGSRNERPLKLRYVSNRYEGGFVYLAGASLHVFSENFLMLLSRAERRPLQFQLVDCLKKTRKQFFELVGPSGPPLVALTTGKVTGWQCTACGARVFGYDYSPDKSIYTFIARADLAQPCPEVFTIGTQPNVLLCMSAQRWADLVGQRGGRGLISRLVGVVPDDEVVRQPNLEPRNK
jgi:hypothetical protein